MISNSDFKSLVGIEELNTQLNIRGEATKDDPMRPVYCRETPESTDTSAIDGNGVSESNDASQDNPKSGLESNVESDSSCKVFFYSKANKSQESC